jgi:ADP-ribosylglycohydrolase
VPTPRSSAPWTRLPGSVSQRARCLGILGATAFFGGDVDLGQTRFTAALELVEAQPEDERDRTIHTTLLGNLGVVAEARGDWTLAERHHSEALRLRREIADARGVLHSTHALGRVRLALGGRDAGTALFDEAEQLASDLDEPLERAKVTHTRAELALGDGDSDTAETLAAAAHEVFERCATRYDVTHTQLTLATAAQAGGRHREALQRGAVARASVASHGYGLLGRLYPQTAFPYDDRIAAGLTAYACGDALGVPWEGRPPSDATAEEIEVLPTRGDWPPGATSDDTALTLLVAEHLVEHDGSVDSEAFLARLAERAPTVRGLGPSTLEAIRILDEAGRLPTEGGNTNGAPMRALPLGWATALEDAARRRQLVVELSRSTHPSPEAQVAACVMAACASWALEGAAGRLLVEIAIEEARAAAELSGTSGGLADQLVTVSNGEWTPPADGIGLDPYETVVASLACVVGAPSLRDALVRAVGLGGDTDTVAALTGGLLGCASSREDVLAELPWLSAVTLPPDDVIVDVSGALARLRAGGGPPSTR